MTAAHKAIEYWSQPDISNAKRVIASHAAWEYDALRDLAFFLTPAVKATLLNDFRWKTCLEIGCGVGRLLLPMATVFDEVLGVDICPRMVELSTEYLAPFPEKKKIITLLGDGETLPVSNERIDFVYSTIVFQHLPSLEVVRSYLKEAFRVLRPGGLARIQTFEGPPPSQWDPHWGYFFPSLEKFTAEFEQTGFKVVEKQKDTLWALAQRREPIEKDWLWVTAIKPR